VSETHKPAKIYRLVHQLKLSHRAVYPRHLRPTENRLRVAFLLIAIPYETRCVFVFMKANFHSTSPLPECIVPLNECQWSPITATRIQWRAGCRSLWYYPFPSRKAFCASHISVALVVAFFLPKCTRICHWFHRLARRVYL
jgi:hypothetical protein